MENLVEQLKSFLEYTKSSFGRYAAKAALNFLAEEKVLQELTEHEVYAILEHKIWRKDFPRLKRVWPVTLSAYDFNCPYCKNKIWGNVRFVTVVKETPDIDLILLVCKCGTAFRKYEDKREEI
jgi:hypothetical protein